MATKEQLQEWLDEAEAAYNSLMLGKAVVSVSYQGRSVNYTQANKVDLQSYIEELKGKISGSRSGGRLIRF